MWQDFREGLTNFTNNPVVISIISVLSILFAVLVVLSRTSIGRKFLKLFKEKLAEHKEEIDAVVKVAKEAKEDVEKFKDEAKEEIQEFKDNTSNKVVAIQSQFELFESDLFKILELIPNDKVKAQLELWKKNYSSQKEEIANLIGDSYSAVQEKINQEVKIRTEQSQQEIAALKGEIAQLKELVIQCTKVAETAKESEKNEDGEQREEEIID